jgi:hypothetical protein
MTSRFLNFTLLAAALSCGGCSVINEYEDPTLVGKWEGDDTSPESNEMDIELDGKGDATIAFQGGNVELDIKWEYKTPTKYELKFECSNAGCGVQDFEFECKEKKEGEELECESETVTGLLEWKKK